MNKTRTIMLLFLGIGKKNNDEEVTVMKVRRSDRLVDMTRYLLERPRTLISLKFLRNVMIPQNPQLVKTLEF